MKSLDKLINYFWPDPVNNRQNLQKLQRLYKYYPKSYAITKSYSELHKLPDLTVKVNSVNVFNNSMHSFINPTAHIIITYYYNILL